MEKWRFLRKAFLGIVAVSVLSLTLTGCKTEGDHPSGGEHPSKEHSSKPDHPEHPK